MCRNHDRENESAARETGVGRQYADGRKSFAFFVFVLATVFSLSAAHPVPASTASWSPETEIRQYLKEHYPWAEVSVGELWMSAEPPAEKPSSLVVLKAPPGRTVVRFAFRHHRSIKATAKVRVFDRVFMSRSAFRRDHVIERGDIYSTLLESGRIPKGAVRDEAGIIGKPLLRSVIPNVPITDRMVSETPIVKRGHKVTLSVESEGFTIKAIGEMKSSAAVGEYVKVVNRQTKRIVTGRLVDENTVLVEY